MVHTSKNYHALREEQAKAAENPSQDIEPDASPNLGSDGEQQPEPPQSNARSDEQEQQRATSVYTNSPGWTEKGGMVAQNESANAFNAWVNSTHRRDATPNLPDQNAGGTEREAGLPQPDSRDHAPEISNHAIERGGVAEQQAPNEMQPEPGRAPLRFYEDLKREHAEALDREKEPSQSEERAERDEPGRKTLSFFEDRNPAQDHEQEH